MQNAPEQLTLLPLWSLGQFDPDDYENNSRDIVESGGTIEGYHIIDEGSLLDFKGGQVRAKDLDKGNIARIKQEIEARGLKEAAVVMRLGKEFKTISGHHRIEAKIQISRANGETSAHLPVIVVSSNWDEIELDFWKQRENTKHNSSKSHTKDDAIKFIGDLRSKNYRNWANRNDEENIKREVYDALEKAKYTYQGKHRKDIFIGAFDDVVKKDTVKAVSSSDASRDARTIFNQTKDLWENNVYVVGSSQDASRKCLQIALQERGAAILKGEVNPHISPRGEIKMLVHFPPAYKSKDSLKNQRINYLEDLKSVNILQTSSLNCKIVEVVFPMQFRGRTEQESETKNIRFVWSETENNWNKI